MNELVAYIAYITIVKATEAKFRFF
jgi:hypothetical protein